MPEVSLNFKRVREPEEGGKEEGKTGRKKNRNDKDDTAEFDSCVEHLRVIVEELESSNFQNIRMVLGMKPFVDVEHAIGSMIAMTDSTRSEETIPSNIRKYYKERKQIIKKNVCLKDFHEELKREGF